MSMTMYESVMTVRGDELANRWLKAGFTVISASVQENPASTKRDGQGRVTEYHSVTLYVMGRPIEFSLDGRVESVTVEAVPTPKRKRGRPSKAEIEARKAAESAAIFHYQTRPEPSIAQVIPGENGNEKFDPAEISDDPINPLSSPAQTGGLIGFRELQGNI